MLQKIKNTIKEIGVISVSLTLAFIIFIGLSISNAWTEPAGVPPAGNLSAPINASVNAQIKSGALQMNGLRNLGNTILDGTLTMPSGAGAGKVLTSDASGNVTLQTPKIATYNDLPKGSIAGFCSLRSEIAGNGEDTYLVCNVVVLPGKCVSVGIVFGGDAKGCACETGFTAVGSGCIKN